MDDAGASLQATMAGMGRTAREGARALRLATPEQRTAAIRAMAAAIREDAAAILAANARDLARAAANGLTAPMQERLLLDEKRLEGVAAGVEAVAAIPDPVGVATSRWTRPNGLDISRVRTPIGVIAMIYESRPNVTADAAALCVRSGNAVILRGGSECIDSNLAIHASIERGLKAAGLPAAAVQIVKTPDRAAVGAILSGLDKAIDLIIPRGGKSLVARVQAEARAPVLGHLEGLNHVFVHAAADVNKAVDIVVNAKLRRVSVCGSAETLLVDKAAADVLLPPIARALVEAGCELRGDAAARAIEPAMKAATQEDWTTEYLAPILAVAVVDGVAGAAAHIAAYGSGHTDAIVTEDASAADAFVDEVDSAIVLVNASTQFADGGEFGFGAEIGIATDKLHARGPVGAEQLTTFKYVVRGTGQTRP
ncbi:glutamate-5-semialdehyde dehydrogenase [Caulobacter segnis]|jgi:glutamate-5-semialdehyde dehydrogenase|uniref:glutamate-5-semialdehyde dehydrogenase n=1 Tax=Caulobacter segnis TaxID=88688 RepID=UPI001CBFFC9D|nr:glutamate-5-semialdehyde dehydrogenase [Caulobacter segnis]UAL10372.1 glutamate-5-semialdehyde dehydrogenase [Caulobacter segnis]